ALEQLATSADVGPLLQQAPTGIPLAALQRYCRRVVLDPDPPQRRGAALHAWRGWWRWNSWPPAQMLARCFSRRPPEFHWPHCSATAG
ncbi:hypothetical protein C7E25_23300, partial [Stenotrophomonas maltophilia]